MNLELLNKYFLKLNEGVIYLSKDHVIDFINTRPEVMQFLDILWLILQNTVNIAIGKISN